MSSEALQGPVMDPMSDTLTPHEAARVVASASRYEDSLVQRTEGLTQMVWGLVTPAIFVTYAFAGLVHAPGWVFALLWAPWVAAGAAATMALWRSAALSRPGGMAFERPRGFLLRFLAVSAVFMGAFSLLQPDGTTVPLAVVGAVWTLMALLNVICASPLGRGLWAFCGTALLGTAALLAATGAPIEVSGTLSILVPGAVPLATGLYQTLRG